MRLRCYPGRSMELSLRRHSPRVASRCSGPSISITLSVNRDSCAESPQPSTLSNPAQTFTCPCAAECPFFWVGGLSPTCQRQENLTLSACACACVSHVCLLTLVERWRNHIRKFERTTSWFSSSHPFSCPALKEGAPRWPADVCLRLVHSGMAM